jgi:hypothetical protein
VWRSLTAQLMLVALGILVAATVIGVIHLWPQGTLKSQGGQFTQPQTVPARVTMLIFNIGGRSFTDAINNEAVAEQIVGTLVGHVPPRRLRDAHPAHAH